jgi:hypothetical protein
MCLPELAHERLHAYRYIYGGELTIKEGCVCAILRATHCRAWVFCFGSEIGGGVAPTKTISPALHMLSR